MEAPRDLHTNTSKLRMRPPRSLMPLNMIMPIGIKTLTMSTLHRVELLGNILILTGQEEMATEMFKIDGKTALNRMKAVHSMDKRISMEVEGNQCNSPTLER